MKYIKKLKNKKRLVIIVAVTMLIVALPFVYVYGFGGNLFGWAEFQDTEDSRPGVNEPRNAEDDATKQEGNQGHSSGNDESNTGGGTGVVDSEGSDVDGGQSGGVSSESGDITLLTPQEGQKLENGQSIQGGASVDKVFYRLEDDVRGVIGTGELQVRDGKFSGTLSLNTSGKNGTLDVYSFDGQDREVNSIRIKVTY